MGCHATRETKVQRQFDGLTKPGQCTFPRAIQVLGDLAHEALEGKLADQKLGGLLVLADLAQRDRAGAVTVGLLDA